MVNNFSFVIWVFSHLFTDFRYLAFGFLAGNEAKAAGLGNIGLRDRKHSLLSLE